MMKMMYRVESIKALVKNMREPKVVRRCLELDNKRLIKQIITGKRVAFSEVQ